MSTQRHEQRNDLDAARGCFAGILGGILFWMLLAGALALFWWL